MILRMRWAAVIALIITSESSVAQSAGAFRKHVLSFTGIVLSSSTTQGGAGPSGSTLLTNTEYVYGRKWWGVGLFSQYDMQGSAQKDSAYGPKLEFRMGSRFFFEYCYAMSAKRAFTDRNVAEQTGDGSVMGLGVRFGIGRTAGKGPIFQAVYKHRTMNMKKQDGVDLSQPITQVDSYPVLGFGFSF